MSNDPLIVTTFEAGTHCPLGGEQGGFVGFVDQVESDYLPRIDQFREKRRETVAVKRDFETRARARGWAIRTAADMAKSYRSEAQSCT